MQGKMESEEPKRYKTPKSKWESSSIFQAHKLSDFQSMHHNNRKSICITTGKLFSFICFSLPDHCIKPNCVNFCILFIAGHRVLGKRSKEQDISTARNEARYVQTSGNET